MAQRTIFSGALVKAAKVGLWGFTRLMARTPLATSLTHNALLSYAGFCQTAVARKQERNTRLDSLYYRPSNKTRSYQRTCAEFSKQRPISYFDYRKQARSTCPPQNSPVKWECDEDPCETRFDSLYHIPSIKNRSPHHISSEYPETNSYHHLYNNRKLARKTCHSEKLQEELERDDDPCEVQFDIYHIPSTKYRSYKHISPEYPEPKVRPQPISYHHYRKLARKPCPPRKPQERYDDQYKTTPIPYHQQFNYRKKCPPKNPQEQLECYDDPCETWFDSLHHIPSIKNRSSQHTWAEYPEPKVRPQPISYHHYRKLARKTCPPKKPQERYDDLYKTRPIPYHQQFNYRKTCPPKKPQEQLKYYDDPDETWFDSLYHIPSHKNEMHQRTWAEQPEPKVKPQPISYHQQFDYRKLAQRTCPTPKKPQVQLKRYDDQCKTRFDSLYHRMSIKDGTYQKTWVEFSEPNVKQRPVWRREESDYTKPMQKTLRHKKSVQTVSTEGRLSETSQKFKNQKNKKITLPRIPRMKCRMDCKFVCGSDESKEFCSPFPAKPGWLQKTIPLTDKSVLYINRQDWTPEDQCASEV